MSSAIGGVKCVKLAWDVCCWSLINFIPASTGFPGAEKQSDRVHCFIMHAPEPLLSFWWHLDCYFSGPVLCFHVIFFPLYDNTGTKKKHFYLLLIYILNLTLLLAVKNKFLLMKDHLSFILLYLYSFTSSLTVVSNIVSTVNVYI